MMRGLYNEGTIRCGDYMVRRLGDKKGLHGENMMKGRHSEVTTW